jgi:hypothetical protein
VFAFICWLYLMVRSLCGLATTRPSMKLLVCGNFLSFLVLRPCLATPLLALKEAQECAACHNAGRSQRPVLERRCTLDCQGCHIDPSGGGARNQWGQYYSHAALNLLSFWKPEDPLKDESYFDLHGDMRVISVEGQDHKNVYPMAAEFTARLRPIIRYLHLVYTPQFLGRVGDKKVFSVSQDSRRFRQKYALMIDALPLNLFVRWFRGTPTYGLRRPNHTLWIRQRIGLDQYAATDAIEVGGTPNVPFLRYSYMFGDPWAKPHEKQVGSSFHGGFRGVTAAWHVNTSWWDTRSSSHRIQMAALGAGLHHWGVLLYGERNWRKISEIDEPVIPIPSDARPASRSGVQPSSVISDYEIAYTALPGTILGFHYETLEDIYAQAFRNSVVADFHLLPFLQFEIWRRFETGGREFQDTLGILHAYYDF